MPWAIGVALSGARRRLRVGGTWVIDKMAAAAAAAVGRCLILTGLGPKNLVRRSKSGMGAPICGAIATAVSSVGLLVEAAEAMFADQSSGLAFARIDVVERQGHPQLPRTKVEWKVRSCLIPNQLTKSAGSGEAPNLHMISRLSARAADAAAMTRSLAHVTDRRKMPSHECPQGRPAVLNQFSAPEAGSGNLSITFSPRLLQSLISSAAMPFARVLAGAYVVD